MNIIVLLKKSNWFLVVLTVLGTNLWFFCNINFSFIEKDRVPYSCIHVYSYSCLYPLSNERKSMFKPGDTRAVWTWVWTWKYLKRALHYWQDIIYRKRCRPDWSFRCFFCSRKRCIRLWRCYDLMTFESTQPTPFCLDKSSVRKWTI